MDDEAIGADQARAVRAALSAADLELGRVWMHYFRLGGDVSELEVDAYLHQALPLPALQRDLLAQSVTELADGHRIPRLPFTSDYHAPPVRSATDAGPVTPPPSGPEGLDGTAPENPGL